MELTLREEYCIKFCVVGNSDIPLQLLQSISSPYLETDTIIDSIYWCGNLPYSKEN